LGETVDIERAAPELLVAIGDIIQFTIINTELGYNLRTCATLWMRIKHKMDIPVKPGLLPVVLKRMTAANHGPTQGATTWP
jgi:hypothetical protein